MKLLLKYNLPFASATVVYQEKMTEISDILIDTGSAKSILAADMVESIGVSPENGDMPRIIRGVGGTELVFSRRMDSLKLGDCSLPDFEVEIGGMDYGFEINGIIGTDFLIKAEATINMKEMLIDFGIAS